jgi:hypothetical protein
MRLKIFIVEFDCDINECIVVILYSLDEWTANKMELNNVSVNDHLISSHVKTILTWHC